MKGPFWFILSPSAFYQQGSVIDFLFNVIFVRSSRPTRLARQLVQALERVESSSFFLDLLSSDTIIQSEGGFIICKGF